MKKLIIICILIVASFSAFAQESMFTFGGGYSSAKIKDAESGATGYRINAGYEFNPQAGKWSHGIEFGYIHLSSTNGAVTSTVNSFPIYYVPKLIFGGEKFKYYVKGVLGMQIAGIHREGLVTLDDTDMGFYLGGGAGFRFFLSESLFLSAEYELAYASNAYYRDGWVNSATAGIGFRF